MSVSVVLCTYNGEPFLPRLWHSLLAQTRLPRQIVVRDDASTDGTPGLLERLRGEAQARGIEVVLARNGRNLGFVGNFEAAVRDASGAIVFLCDQDDVWHPEKIATMLAAFAQRPRLTLLHGDARLVDEGGNAMGCTLFRAIEVTRAELAMLHGGRAFDALLRRNLATGATLAFRRSLLADALPFPPQWVHDEWLAIIAAVLGEVDCLEQALIDYRQHAANQIGAQWRGLAQKWARAGEPRQAYLDGLVERTRILIERLRAQGPRVAPQCIAKLQRKLAHLQARAAMPACRPCRAPAILREVAGGGYAKFGMGPRAIAYDLFGKG